MLGTVPEICSGGEIFSSGGLLGVDSDSGNSSQIVMSNEPNPPVLDDFLRITKRMIRLADQAAKVKAMDALEKFLKKHTILTVSYTLEEQENGEEGEPRFDVRPIPCVPGRVGCGRTLLDAIVAIAGTEERKFCNSCREKVPVRLFYGSRDAKDGRDDRCSFCERKRAREGQRRRRAAKREALRGILQTPSPCMCPACKLEKPDEAFWFRKERSSVCRKCVLEKQQPKDDPDVLPMKPNNESETA